MRRLVLLSSVLFPSALAAFGACGDSGADRPNADASSSDSSDGGGTERRVPLADTSPQTNCKLGDGSDPVGLCIQKVVLQQVLLGAYAKGKGVASGWDSNTGIPDTDDAGATLHSWRDDVAFASSIATYHCNSSVYGDNEITPKLDNALADLAATIEGELSAPPEGYDGETYLRLRNAAAGLFFINENDHANKLAKIADDYGRAIQSKYAQIVAQGTVLGVASNGSVSYVTADVASGAVALLHMALLHLKDDAGSAATWQATAEAALDYAAKRARDPQTQIFYRSLVASSGDGGADTLPSDPGAGNLWSDDQASIVLSLARAQDLEVAIATTRRTLQEGGSDAQALMPPYFDMAAALVAAMSAKGLGFWDGPQDTTSKDPGAYLEGLAPSDGGAAAIANKTTFSTAIMLGGLHRVAYGSGSQQSYQLGELRSALLQRTPANSSLLSLVAGQQGYFRAATRDWHTAAEPRGASYRTEAAADMVEGMTQLWIGRQNPPQCAP